MEKILHQLAMHIRIYCIFKKIIRIVEILMILYLGIWGGSAYYLNGNLMRFQFFLISIFVVFLFFFELLIRITKYVLESTLDRTDNLNKGFIAIRRDLVNYYQELLDKLVEEEELFNMREHVKTPFSKKIENDKYRLLKLKIEYQNSLSHDKGIAMLRIILNK